MSKEADTFEGKINSIGKAINSFKNLAIVGAFAAIGRGMYNLGKWALGLSASFEQTRISYQVMLGDIKRGNELLAQVKGFANATPYGFEELSQAGKTLLGYGVSANKIMPTLRMLGDVAAGDAEKLRLITLAYSQIQASGRLMGQDLLQLVNAGFNPLQIISQRTGISIGVLKKKMEEGAISAEDVAKAFRIATSEGGLFYKMTEKQAETLGGKWGILMDTIKTVATQAGDSIANVLLPELDALNERLEKLSDPNRYKIKELNKDLQDRGKILSYVEQIGEYRRYPQTDAQGRRSSAAQLADQLERDALAEFPQFARKFENGVAVGFDHMRAKNYLKSTSPLSRESVKKDLDKQIADQQKIIAWGDQALGTLRDKGDKGLIYGQRAVAKETEKLKDLVSLRQSLNEPERAKNLIASGLSPNEQFDIKNGKGKKGDKVDGEIRSGGVKNITININQLVGQINFDSFEVTEQKAVEIVKRGLLTAVNDANTVID